MPLVPAVISEGTLVGVEVMVDIPDQPAPAPSGGTSTPDYIVSPGGGDAHAMIQDAVDTARHATHRTIRLLAGHYDIGTSPIVIESDDTAAAAKIEFLMDRNATIRYAGVDAAFKLINARDCELKLGSVEVTHQDASGVRLIQQGSIPGQHDSARCHLHGGHIRNLAGRRASKPALNVAKSIGIDFWHSGVGGVSNYFHRIERIRIDEFDANVLVGAGCNANYFSMLDLETAWYMFAILSLENQMESAFFHRSPGTAADLVECIRLGDAGVFARWNRLSCAMEPGVSGSNREKPLVVRPGSSNNVIVFTRNMYLGYNNSVDEPDNKILDQQGIWVPPS